MGSGAARWLVLLVFQCRSIDNEGRIDRASARICAADSVMFFLKVLESSWSFLHHHSIFSAVRLFKLSMLAALVLDPRSRSHTCFEAFVGLMEGEDGESLRRTVCACDGGTPC